ncbi:Auxin-induced protein X10A [Hibiscus syriacus]|uniref:Auxin-induced protein X10A n=1 Tax=Hibiscus syriacus TaxID=106335 RepID=A0A6A3A8A7_HIBSY|nr:auxin-induced protein X10A-like [Hibiscus syriacus]KAE8700358.1 Auxin-induced protein X10A [Hibiscus syriacus]
MVPQSGVKSTGIKQIVRLKGMLQKWQTVTFGSRPNTHNSKGNHGDVSPSIRKIQTDITHNDSDDESCHSPEPAPDVPKGYLAVYVGPELRRFIIPTGYLSHPVFKILLEKAEEEFGYDHSGGLTLPCEIETFKYLLNYIENQPTAHNVGGNPISEHNYLICI